MQTESISSLLNNLTSGMMKSEQDPTIEKWKSYVSSLEKDIADAGLELMPPNLAEIFAKLITKETKDGKGILFFGTVGSGKTARMRLFSSLTGMPMFSAKSFGERWADGDFDDYSFREVLCRTVSRLDEHPKFYHDLIIDDLGTEEPKYSRYGQSRDVMSDVLAERYSAFTDIGKRYRTLITTNLTQQQLKQRYGDRIYSRINGMCAFVTMVAKDRRIKNA